MKEVSKEEFYRVIGPLDAHPKPNTSTDVTVFENAFRVTVGVVKLHQHTKEPIHYYLP
jgi:hypothetical protein